MPPTRTFSQYLIGQASFERPSFFYAYAGMWLHLLIGTILFLLFATSSWLEVFPSLVIGSFSLGIFIYGLLAREYGLIINLVSYVFSMIRTMAPETMGFVFFLIAILTALVSAFDNQPRFFFAFLRLKNSFLWAFVVATLTRRQFFNTYS